jgi:hypothetical protein
MAVWFAQQFGFKSRAPLIANGVARKATSLLYLGERNEQEIVWMRFRLFQ